MARSKVKSRRRLKIYLGWLAATVGLILAACFAVNCLVDPLWYLRGNVLTQINYPFNERLAAMIRFLPRLDDYDCVIFGTSRASLLPEEKIEGYRCYNLSVSDGIAPEYLLYAKYLAERGYKPRLIIVDVKRAEFLGPQQAAEVPDFVRTGSSPPSISPRVKPTRCTDAEPVLPQIRFARGFGGIRGAVPPSGRYGLASASVMVPINSERRLW